MSENDSKEQLLNDGNSEDYDWKDTEEHKYRRYERRSPLKRALVYTFSILPWALLLLLGAWHWSWYQQYKSRYYIRPDLTYSPLQDLVEYELKSFTTGKEGISGYAAEPSDEVDKLWTGLYPSLWQLIPQEQAAQLPNRTVIFPHDEQRRYVIELDVFHQLHCLNQVRKATRPDYYIPSAYREGNDEDPLIGHRHVAHCIDAIRQSLMCHADITPYTWTWNEEAQSLENHVKNLHTCRNFDALQDWARVNTMQLALDGKVHVMNDPLDPETWLDGWTP